MTVPVKVLVTGATGNTGSALIGELGKRANVNIRTATRSPTPATHLEHVRFDWFDDTTHGEALSGIEHLYLVAPAGAADPARVVEPYLRLAVDMGVRRVVFLSSSAVAMGDPGLGEIASLVKQRFAEWEVLRPSWFMQNFTGDHPLADGIRASGRFFTATGQGRVPFVDAADIARCAAVLLTSDSALNTEHLITGPHALTYSEAADIVGSATGRVIKHESVSVDEYTTILTRAGYEPSFASALAALDQRISSGEQAQVSDTVEVLTGRRPRSLSAFVGGNR